MKLILNVEYNDANSTPNRHWDYIASIADNDEYSPVGLGQTEEEALLDLMEQYINLGEIK